MSNLRALHLLHAHYHKNEKIVRLFLLSIIGLWLQQQQNRRFLSLPLKPLFSINRNSARRQKRRLSLSPLSSLSQFLIARADLL